MADGWFMVLWPVLLPEGRHSSGLLSLLAVCEGIPILTWVGHSKALVLRLVPVGGMERELSQSSRKNKILFLHGTVLQSVHYKL